MLPASRTLRIAADVVAAALGLNLWVSFVLVPGVFIGSFARVHAFLAVAPVPLAVLAVGLVRRSPMWLLLAYPATLLVPVALDPRTVSESVQSPLGFVIIAASLVGFFLGSAYLTAIARSPGDPPAAKIRRLGASLDTRNPARWRRRRRIYVALGVLSALFPAALVYEIDFRPETRAYLAELYPGDRMTSMLALLNLGALGLWLAAFAIGFVGPLRHHRTGDPGLVRELERLRLETQKATPRLAFYVGVVSALGLMAVLLYMRGLLGPGREVNVRRWFFEILALLLIGGSLVFFWECVSYLAKRDYIAAIVLVGIGLSVLTVGKELARLALVQKE